MAQKQRKPRETQEVVSPRIKDFFDRRLRELGWDGAEFVRRMHSAYGPSHGPPSKGKKTSGGARNHLYKILGGTATVGENGLLPKICKLLNLDYDEAVRLLRADKIEKKGWDSALPRADKTLREIASHWETLSKGDKAMIADLVHIKALGVKGRS